MSDPSFHQEVQKIRDHLIDKSISTESDLDISHSYVAAEGLIEQVFHSTKLSCPKSQIKLLKVYAGPHSPLVEAVRSLGFQAMRFTKADGDLSTVSGRRKFVGSYGNLLIVFNLRTFGLRPNVDPGVDGPD